MNVVHIPGNSLSIQYLIQQFAQSIVNNLFVIYDVPPTCCSLYKGIIKATLYVIQIQEILSKVCMFSVMNTVLAINIVQIVVKNTMLLRNAKPL